MQQPIRILQSVNIMDRAGLETMLMNYYRNIDRDVIQFDFLTHRPQDGAYDEEIISMGGQVYHAPRLYPQNLPKYYSYMKDFYKAHPEYTIIHSHIDAMSYFPLKAAKNNHIPVRIAHCHSTKLDRDLKFPIKYYALNNICKVANFNCACGDLAGHFMFKNNPYKVICNAIDLDRFTYNSEIRNNQRIKHGLQGKFVIGHVGRYCYIKNQLFLIDVFAEILKKKDNAVLLLIGKGPDERKIREKVKSLGLADKVRLMIDRSDVNLLYQTFDVFVMPSLFEGLPMVGVEAQANGLPYFVSDRVSDEVLLTSNVKQISLKATPSEWAEEIIEVDNTRNNKAKSQLQNAGYDISVEAKKLQDLYLKMYERN